MNTAIGGFSRPSSLNTDAPSSLSPPFYPAKPSRREGSSATQSPIARLLVDLSWLVLVNISIGVVLLLVEFVMDHVLGGGGTRAEGCVAVLCNVCRLIMLVSWLY